MTEIAKWGLVILLATAALATPARVGQPRKPMTVAEATFEVVLDILLIVAIVIWWQP